MKIRIMLLVVMLGIVGRVDAGVRTFYTAGKILSYCESADVRKQDACTDYLAGISDATGQWVAWGDMSKRVCKPSGVNTRQLRKIYIKYANEHPENLHFAAASVVITAFTEAFPCK